LEYTDNKSNGVLHVACASNGEGVEEQKKEVVARLLSLGFILDDDNVDGVKCRDLVPKEFEKDLRGKARGWERERDRAEGRLRLG